MNEASPAEEVLRSVHESFLENEGLEILNAVYHVLTSEAYVDMLHVRQALATTESYSLEQTGTHGDDQEFNVVWNTKEGPVTGTVRMRLIRGAWRITAVKIPGIRD